MSNWKIKKSKRKGVVPNVNHFPDPDYAIWNTKDRKLYCLGFDDNDNPVVVCIGGGVNTIGETHARLHQITSEDDHAPAPEAYWGKYVKADPLTGKIIFDDVPLQGISIVLIAGFAGYIEPSQHNLGPDIEVNFYHVYDNAGTTIRKQISIHHEIIGTDGRIYWESSFSLESHVALIK